MFNFSQRSLNNLDGVHPDLADVCHLALKKTRIDFIIIEGVRNRRRQEELVASGSSWTMDSRHLTGHAIDVVAWINGDISWAWPLYHQIYKAFQEAADELNVDIEWGGHWAAPKCDGPHIQLSRRKYPAANDNSFSKEQAKPRVARKAKRKSKKTTKSKVA